VARFHVRDENAAERRVEERMRRRTEILNAAEVEAREVGWNGLTVAGVARRVRLSRGLVYIHFKQRDDLVAGIRDRAVEFLARHMAGAATESPTGLSKLRAALAAAARFAQTHPLYFESFLRTEVLSLDRGIRGAGDFLGSKGEPCRRILARVIAQGQRDGSIQSDAGEPAVVAAILWRFIYGLLQLGAGGGVRAGGKSLPLSLLVDRALDLVRASVTGDCVERPAAAAGTAPAEGHHREY